MAHDSNNTTKRSLLFWLIVPITLGIVFGLNKLDDRKPELREQLDGAKTVKTEAAAAPQIQATTPEDTVVAGSDAQEVSE